MCHFSTRKSSENKYNIVMFIEVLVCRLALRNRMRDIDVPFVFIIYFTCVDLFREIDNT